jgi:hypothetical protein
MRYDNSATVAHVSWGSIASCNYAYNSRNAVACKSNCALYLGDILTTLKCQNRNFHILTRRSSAGLAADGSAAEWNGQECQCPRRRTLNRSLCFARNAESSLSGVTHIREATCARGTPHISASRRMGMRRVCMNIRACLVSAMSAHAAECAQLRHRCSIIGTERIPSAPQRGGLRIGGLQRLASPFFRGGPG